MSDESITDLERVADKVVKELERLRAEVAEARAFFRTPHGEWLGDLPESLPLLHHIQRCVFDTDLDHDELMIEIRVVRAENADLHRKMYDTEIALDERRKMYDIAVHELCSENTDLRQETVNYDELKQHHLLHHRDLESAGLATESHCAGTGELDTVLMDAREEAYQKGFDIGHALDEVRLARARRDVAGLRDAWKAKAKQLRRLELSTHREYLTLRYGLRDWLRKHDVDDTGLEVVPGLFPGTIGSALDDVAIQIRREGAEAAAEAVSALADDVHCERPTDAEYYAEHCLRKAADAIRALPPEYTASEARQEEPT